MHQANVARTFRSAATWIIVAACCTNISRLAAGPAVNAFAVDCSSRSVSSAFTSQCAWATATQPPAQVFSRGMELSSTVVRASRLAVKSQRSDDVADLHGSGDHES